MTEVPDNFPELSRHSSAVDKKLLLGLGGIGAMGAIGIAGLIYKLTSERLRNEPERIDTNDVSGNI